MKASGQRVLGKRLMRFSDGGMELSLKELVSPHVRRVSFFSSIL
jgi:hypothetical protein